MLTKDATDKSYVKPSFISLFSGCGGLDLGFIKAGFVPKAAYDIWPLAVENYEKNLGQHIKVLDLSHAKIPYTEQCDIVVAGSPCQGFSTVGKRQVDDPRNNLLHAAVKIAIDANPKVMVFENVPGILQGAHKGHWDQACETIAAAGYDFSGMTIDSRDIGIPQTRKRVILVAWKKNINLIPEIKKRQPPTLRDVIKGASKLSNHAPKKLTVDSADYKIASHIKAGQKLCNVRGAETSVHTWEIPEVFGDTSDEERQVLNSIMKLRRRKRIRNYGDADPVSLESIQAEVGRKVLRNINSLIKKNYIKTVESKVDLRHTFNGKYRRALPEGASFTVDSRFGDPQCFLHPTKQRGFSVREAARIQGFPDDYVFHGSLEDQFRLVANAVPPLMGFAIGEMIKAAFVGKNHE
ncbi:DNA cytosine methyltransferase [Pseudomonas sp. ATCC PTA-122608]|uniref:DNA cytosine methyltransferase n=1 Tax=Pseudomonas sp. ATCC PTA-122608 TaxID=1771311 RepID=UPI00096BD0A1|nr:DNA cytosine methyltransferase [Pseudomonas sp. ATCC PTA-122608]